MNKYENAINIIMENFVIDNTTIIGGALEVAIQVLREKDLEECLEEGEI